MINSSSASCSSLSRSLFHFSLMHGMVGFLLISRDTENLWELTDDEGAYSFFSSDFWLLRLGLVRGLLLLSLVLVDLLEQLERCVLNGVGLLLQLGG